DRFRQGQSDRAARLDELKKETPKDGDHERDPLEFRRARLRKLHDGGSNDQEERKRLEGEIADLERINRIRGTVDLVTRWARVELSVVIGLDVDGPGILDIVTIGDFAGGR